MMQLSSATLDAILPPPSIRSFDWICENVCNKRGLPFDYLSYPWTKGICDEWDNPRRERIFFQAGSRLGKTELGMALLECGLANSPDIAMIGGPTDSKVAQWIKDRLVPMIENCMPLANSLPPAHRRPPHKLTLTKGTIYGAWSGSPTTLGDLDPRYLLGFEVDKFTKASSEEADSLLLLLERGAEIPNRRVYCESTPTVYGRSRIDKFVRNGTNCRFHVPCPHCGKFQKLELGRPGGPGLIWDHDDDGHSNPTLAYKTARYQCKFCRREIDEKKRFSMVQGGVWCPAGCKVNKRGRLYGTPENDGPDATFQLSRMYGPTFTFGRYARAFVEAVKDPDPEVLRSFDNNWKGECWSPNYSLKPWEKVAERLCIDDLKLREVPKSGQFVTMGVDVQVDHWVFYVTSWSAGGRGSTIAYGIVHSWDEVAELVKMQYKHADGGPDMDVCMTLIDARDGNRTDEVTGFCRGMMGQGHKVYPCMGSRTANLKGKTFSKQVLDDKGKVSARQSRRRGFEEFYLITVNTNIYQNWIHNALNRRDPDDEDSIVFPASARYDEDLFDQLLSEHPEWDKADQCKWVKNTEQTVNDLRDACRYSRCAADVYVNQNWNRVSLRRTLTEQKKVPGDGIRRPNPGQSRAPKKAPWVRRISIGR